MVQSGLLVLDKPAGVSSRDCVNRIVRTVGDRKLKVGHCGTLDPLATGVLLVAVGDATRLVEPLHELDKRYRADFEFGKSSDTLDREGQVELSSTSVVPSKQQLLDACQAWVGAAVMQQPPKFSAIKVKGKRAYDLALQGAEFELEARPVAIHAIDLVRYEFPYWTIELHCGRGTYVRSLARDIAHAVGQSAIMNELVRTAIGPFRLAHALPLDEITSREQIESRLLSPVAGLIHWPKVQLSESQVRAVRHGQAISLADAENANELKCQLGADQARAAALDGTGQLVALLTFDSLLHARPERVFQSSMAANQLSAISNKHNPES